MIKIGQIQYNDRDFNIWINEKSTYTNFRANFVLEGWPYEVSNSYSSSFDKRNAPVVVELIPGVVDFISSREAFDMTPRTIEFTKFFTDYYLMFPSIAEMLKNKSKSELKDLVKSDFIRSMILLQTDRYKLEDVKEMFLEIVEENKIVTNSILQLEGEYSHSLSAKASLYMPSHRDISMRYVADLIDLSGITVLDFVEKAESPFEISRLQYSVNYNVSSKKLKIITDYNNNTEMRKVISYYRNLNEKDMYLMFYQNGINEKLLEQVKSIPFASVEVVKYDKDIFATETKSMKRDAVDTSLEVYKYKVTAYNIDNISFDKEYLRVIDVTDLDFKEDDVVIIKNDKWYERSKDFLAEDYVALHGEIKGDIYIVSTRRASGTYDKLKKSFENVYVIQNESNTERRVFNVTNDRFKRTYFKITEEENKQLLNFYLKELVEIKGCNNASLGEYLFTIEELRNRNILPKADKNIDSSIKKKVVSDLSKILLYEDKNPYLKYNREQIEEVIEYTNFIRELLSIDFTKRLPLEVKMEYILSAIKLQKKGKNNE